MIAPTTERSDGLAIFWNNEIKIKNLGYSKYHIDIKFSDLGGVSWRVSFFYGEAQTHQRYKTCDTMKNLATLNDMPWICLRDFNEVLSTMNMMVLPYWTPEPESNTRLP